MANTPINPPKMPSASISPPKLPRHFFKLLLGAIVACLVFLAGYGLGTKQSPPDGGYRAGYEAARQKLADSGLFNPQTEVKSLAGTVSGVEESSIDIETSTRPANPLDDPLPSSRRVLIGTDTKMYRVETKTREEVEAEQKTYADAVKKYEVAVRAGESGAYPAMPTPEKRVEIGLSDIKDGDRVGVTAAEDIGYATSFTATEIMVLQQSAPGTAPTAETP